MKDYYAILGVSRSDPPEAIRRAYRELAFRLHPDRAGPEATCAFHDVAEAYEVLSDPARRADYDRTHASTQTSPSVAESFPPEVIELELLLTRREARHGGLYRFLVPVSVGCPRCRETGRVSGGHCGTCGGSGELEAMERLEVDVPTRVRDGTWLEAPLQGEGLVPRRARLLVRTG
ncbi:MAG: DnaJ domain-containing protein [Myxococcaceae bacterium]